MKHRRDRGSSLKIRDWGRYSLADDGYGQLQGTRLSSPVQRRAEETHRLSVKTDPFDVVLPPAARPRTWTVTRQTRRNKTCVRQVSEFRVSRHPPPGDQNKF